jgi:hypothetical protein
MTADRGALKAAALQPTLILQASTRGRRIAVRASGFCSS